MRRDKATTINQKRKTRKRKMIQTNDARETWKRTKEDTGGRDWRRADSKRSFTKPQRKATGRYSKRSETKDLWTCPRPQQTAQEEVAC